MHGYNLVQKIYPRHGFVILYKIILKYSSMYWFVQITHHHNDTFTTFKNIVV